MNLQKMHLKKLKKHLTTFVVLCVCATIMTSIAVMPLAGMDARPLGGNSGHIFTGSPAAALPPVNSGPIAIVGDAALDAFCAGNGTTGSGWATAHVIDNIVIDAEGASLSGIEISNTTRYLILRNCTVNGTYSESNEFFAGIRLNNCRHVRIENCTVTENMFGIVLLGCTACDIVESFANASVLLDYNMAITVYDSSDIVVAGCEVYAWRGMYIKTSQQITLANNTVTCNHADYGFNLLISTGNHFLVENNTCHANPTIPHTSKYNSFGGSNGVVRDNRFTSAGFGGKNMIIINNSFRPTAVFHTNMNLASIAGNNMTFSQNILSGDFKASTKGLLNIDRLNNSTITQNIMENFSTGINLENLVSNISFGNLLQNNTVRNCATALKITAQIYDTVFTNNAFLNATTASADIDPAYPNTFSLHGIGNLWGDYTARYPAASAQHGIWNASYEVEAGAGVFDPYPLEYQRPVPATDAFTVACPAEIHVPSVNNTADVAFSGAYEPGYGAGVWAAKLNGRLWQCGLLPVGAVGTIDLDGLAPGDYELAVTAYPASGETYSVVRLFTVVGDVPPAPVIITPSQMIARGDLTLRWEVQPFVTAYRVYINGSLNVSLAPEVAVDSGFPFYTYLYTYQTNSTTIGFGAPGYYFVTLTSTNEYGESAPSSTIVIVVEPEKLYSGHNSVVSPDGLSLNDYVLFGIIGGGGFAAGVIVALFLAKRNCKRGSTVPPSPPGNTKIFTIGPQMASYMNQNPSNPPGGGGSPSP